MEKLIFIDIDGVLTNTHDNSSMLCYSPKTYGLSKTNISVLDGIISKTGAKLVISSSWRNHELNGIYKFRDMEFRSPLADLLEYYKNSFYEIKMAPHLDKRSKYNDINGFFYIMKFVKGYDMHDFQFAVLDDEEKQELYKFKDSFFQINKYDGLTEKDAEKITEFLNLNE